MPTIELDEPTITRLCDEANVHFPLVVAATLGVDVHRVKASIRRVDEATVVDVTIDDGDLDEDQLCAVEAFLRAVGFPSPMRMVAEA